MTFGNVPGSNFHSEGNNVVCFRAFWNLKMTLVPVRNFLHCYRLAKCFCFMDFRVPSTVGSLQLSKTKSAAHTLKAQTQLGVTQFSLFFEKCQKLNLLPCIRRHQMSLVATLYDSSLYFQGKGDFGAANLTCNREIHEVPKFK